MKNMTKIIVFRNFELYLYKVINNLKQRKMETLIETLIKTLRSRKTGYGHFYISIEMDGKKLGTTTTNTLAIDAAFDDCYDDEDNDGRYYKSRFEAQVDLVKEILRANDVEF